MDFKGILTQIKPLWCSENVLAHSKLEREHFTHTLLIYLALTHFLASYSQPATPVISLIPKILSTQEEQLSSTAVCSCPARVFRWAMRHRGPHRRNVTLPSHDSQCPTGRCIPPNPRLAFKTEGTARLHGAVVFLNFISMFKSRATAVFATVN